MQLIEDASASELNRSLLDNRVCAATPVGSVLVRAFWVSNGQVMPRSLSVVAIFRHALPVLTRAGHATIATLCKAHVSYV